MADWRNEVSKPRWGTLYALLALLVGLIGLVEAAVPPGPARQALEIAVTVTMFGVMALWVRLNRVAIDRAGAQDALGSRRPLAAAVLRTDAELVTELKTRLRQEAWATDGDLLIDAHDGVLWLSGPVESATRKSAIEIMARSIQGCRGVRSYLFRRSSSRASVTT